MAKATIKHCKVAFTIQALHWYSGGAEVKTSHSTTAAIHVSVVLAGGGVRRWGRLVVDWGGSGKDSLVGFHATSQRTTRAREANSAASRPWKQRPTGRTQPSRCVNTPTNTPFYFSPTLVRQLFYSNTPNSPLSLSVVLPSFQRLRRHCLLQVWLRNPYFTKVLLAYISIIYTYI